MTAVDPRLALLRALNTPPYDSAAGVYATPLGEAADLLAAHRAFVLREGADKLDTHAALLASVSDDPAAPVAEVGVRAAAEWRMGAALLRRMADEAQQPGASPHSCSNCKGVDPDTCWTNPDRPPEQCSESEFDGYGLQCQKPAGHNLCTFEEETADA